MVTPPNHPSRSAPSSTRAGAFAAGLALLLLGMGLGMGAARAEVSRLGACVRAAASAVGSPAATGTWLNRLLAKPVDAYTGTMNDLGAETPLRLYGQLTTFAEWISDSERYRLLAEFPLDDLVVAPGHQFLRRPQQIPGLVDYLRQTRGGEFPNDPILLNITTGPGGRVTGVDVWNAHHRLVAYRRAGFAKVGDLPRAFVKILVNGSPHGGASWDHFVPAAGIDLDAGFRYRPVPAGGDVQPGTLSVGGELSNHALGSRTTLAQLNRNLDPDRKMPRVGVFFGTYDPVHEGHLQTARTIRHEFDLSEVVLIPNESPLHKPGATSFEDRLELGRRGVLPHDGLNLYVGGTDRLLRDGGKPSIIERVGQIYGTNQLFEVFGDDAYQKLANLGQLDPRGLASWIVVKRKGSPGLHIPDPLRERTFVAPMQDDAGFSSTLVRDLIRSGRTPPPEMLSPRVYEYIRSRGLYGFPRPAP